MHTMGKKIFLGFIMVFLVSSPTLLAKSTENMINTIMKLRGEIEHIYSTIDENKDNYKSQMKSLMMQKADNEAQINRRETSLKLTTSQIDTVQEKLAKQSNTTTSLKPMLDEAILNLEKLINEGIPFKKEARLLDIGKIKSDLKQKNITQEKALSLVWASYDDALRLTQEIGLFKQQITVEGEEKMVKIAKLGSIMMFFATPDEKVGYVMKKDGDYTYNLVTDEIQVAQIVSLFDALQKQIRTGYFSLPNALLIKGAK